jgi:transcriptional regulator with XRE-family HTH domain
MEEWLLEIGDSIQKARKAKKQTRPQLADRAGIAPRTVISIENGEIVGKTGYGILNLYRILNAQSRAQSADEILKIKIPGMSEGQLQLHRDLQRVLDHGGTPASSVEGSISLALRLVDAEAAASKT